MYIFLLNIYLCQTCSRCYQSISIIKQTTYCFGNLAISMSNCDVSIYVITASKNKKKGLIFLSLRYQLSFETNKFGVPVIVRGEVEGNSLFRRDNKLAFTLITRNGINFYHTEQDICITKTIYVDTLNLILFIRRYFLSLI